MLILDTDHMSELGRETARRSALEQRLGSATLPVATTIATAEELLRGRLAQVAGNKSGKQLMVPYRRMNVLHEALSNWLVMPWTETAAGRYDHLRGLRLGIGTMDLRIAAIVIANNATLLSRNLKDFGRVPELKVEDWLA